MRTLTASQGSAMRAWRLAYAPVRSLHTSRASLGIEELLPPSKDADVVISGRAWKAAELRMKSFKELHQLWFVLLKEKSRLMSSREAREQKRGWSGAGRMRKVKESMARLKTVLRERALVYQDTQERLEARQRRYWAERRAGTLPPAPDAPAESAVGNKT